MTYLNQFVLLLDSQIGIRFIKSKLNKQIQC